MSFPYTPNLQEEKLESLQTQHEYLKLLRLRHLQWLSTAETSEMENAHLKVAELLDLLTDRYTQLLRAQEQKEPGPIRHSPALQQAQRGASAMAPSPNTAMET